MQTFIIDFEGLYDKSIKTYFIQEFSYYNLNSDDAHNHFIRIPLHVDFKKYWYQYKNINHIPKAYWAVDWPTTDDESGYASQ